VGRTSFWSARSAVGLGFAYNAILPALRSFRLTRIARARRWMKNAGGCIFGEVASKSVSTSKVKALRRAGLSFIRRDARG
jgi:hypothetical protein